MMKAMVPIVAACFLGGLGMGGCACRRCEEGGKEAAAGLPPGAVIQYVKIRSGLSEEEAMAVLRRRAEEFREVPGLVQKIYGREEGTGEICGIYIFESLAALEAFQETELARTNREAYQVEAGRVERYEVLFTLWPGVTSLRE